MILARDREPNRNRTLVNRKRTSLSLARESTPTATTQRNVPGRTTKRKGAEEITWKNKFQKK